MGTPVVSLAGLTHVSRVSASLLHRVGLDNLVASSPEDYVALAVSLALDHDRLSALRLSLRGRLQSSPLLDALACAQGVEAAYRALWRDYCASN
jgi:predicted O-linked N-acetylglucosamine transferase (SPINDLY family)